MGEDGDLWVKGSAPDISEATSHLDGLCRAGLSEFPPRPLDEIGVTARLLCAGHKPLAFR